MSYVKIILFNITIIDAGYKADRQLACGGGLDDKIYRNRGYDSWH